jgi:uncharacterized protein (TIGR02301 family)
MTAGLKPYLIACLTAVMFALSLASGGMAAEGPSDDYDRKLLRLAEVLGAVHHLRGICGADEGQLWREQMIKLLQAENPSLAFRARLVRSFNQGYRGYRRTYKTCNRAATLAVTRFIREGASLAQSLARERSN